MPFAVLNGEIIKNLLLEPKCAGTAITKALSEVAKAFIIS